MSTKSIIGVFLFVLFFGISTIIYYSSFKNCSNKKNIISNSVEVIGLPDLALYNETIWIRHRSISSVYSVFPEDGVLLDYHNASYIYQIQNGEIKK